MSFRALIRDIQDLTSSIGSISKRRSSVENSKSGVPSSSYHSRSRSHGVVVSQSPCLKDDIALLQQSRWASMPPELLRDVIQRIETGESSWPSRKSVVACAAVCRNWRRITKELVGEPETTGKLTFPVSLKQAGPRDAALQCYIKRDKANSIYRLYLGLCPTPLESGKFLFAAKRLRRATNTEYIISLNPEEQSRGSSSYVGKLRSNFLGTKFTIFDSHPPHSGAVASTSRAGRRIGAKQVSPRIPAGSYPVANIAYELNVLGTRGPRRMHCTIHSIPSSKMLDAPASSTASSSSSTGTEAVNYFEDDSSTNGSNFLLPVSLPKSSSRSSSILESEPAGSSCRFSFEKEHAPLVLKNKAPRWHEQLQCWCLNFRGRVTVASVKNFQLVAADQPPGPDQDKVLLQFGKIGKDMFTMDYRYPLSAFQAFAICLSSFDTKLACE